MEGRRLKKLDVSSKHCLRHEGLKTLSTKEMSLLKTANAKANAIYRSKLNAKKSQLERGLKADSSLEEQSRTSDPTVIDKGIDKFSTEKRLKCLEEKTSQLLEEITETKLHCAELDEKLKYYQQELDVTKKAYAELIFYELNKGNKVLKMNNLNKDEESQRKESSISVLKAKTSSSKVKLAGKKEKKQKKLVQKKKSRW